MSEDAGAPAGRASSAVAAVEEDPVAGVVKANRNGPRANDSLSNGRRVWLSTGSRSAKLRSMALLPGALAWNRTRRPATTGLRSMRARSYPSHPCHQAAHFLRWTMRAFETADPDGKAPIDMQLSIVRHRQAVRKVARQMIAWAPERIVLAHGRCYEKHAEAEPHRAFR